MNSYAKHFLKAKLNLNGACKRLNLFAFFFLRICCQLAVHASKRNDYGAAVQFYREALTFDESDTEVKYYNNFFFQFVFFC